MKNKTISTTIINMSSNNLSAFYLTLLIVFIVYVAYFSIINRSVKTMVISGVIAIGLLITLFYYAVYIQEDKNIYNNILNVKQQLRQYYQLVHSDEKSFTTVNKVIIKSLEDGKITVLESNEIHKAFLDVHEELYNITIGLDEDSLNDAKHKVMKGLVP